MNHVNREQAVKLREKLDNKYGMLDVLKALHFANGDEEIAIAYLQKMVNSYHRLA